VVSSGAKVLRSVGSMSSGPLNMRFEGTDTALMVLPEKTDGDGKEDFEAAFKRAYKAEFGFLLETKTIIVDDIKVGCLPYTLL
jgi:N-methylhydantoinase A/oxoprolinase/acetone carboxylase beta subunit